MKDLLRVARRGVESFLSARAALVLFGSGAAWAILNGLFLWLFLGPALVALFRIALRILRREEPSFRDNLASLDDLPTSLVAGIVFALPFTLWSLLDRLGAVAVATVPEDQATLVRIAAQGIPLTASAALFVHFAFHVFTFPVIAETHAGVIESAQRSRAIADQPGRGNSRLHGLGRHFLFTSAVLVFLLVAARTLAVSSSTGLSYTVFLGLPAIILIGPPAVALLAAWYLHATEHAVPIRAQGGDAGDPEGSGETDEL